MQKDIEKVILSTADINGKVRELAAQISLDYADKHPLMVCILRGAVFFFSDICKAMTIPVKLGFVSLSSYGDNTQSSGEIKIRQALGWHIRNEDIILVEDIVDTGLTMKKYRQYLLENGANSVEICSLLKKPAQKEEIRLTYKGFDIENRFVVGYGLDYAERYRNLPYIGILKKEIYSK